MTHRPLLALLALAVPAAGALAQDLPARKAGLWDVTMTMPGMPGPMGAQHCVDPATDAAMQRQAMQADPSQKCTQKSFKRTATGYEIEAECVSAEGKAAMTMRVAGDFSKAYEMDSTMRFDPPRRGQREMTMKTTARHAGACPAGMAPGQIRMAGMPGMGGGSGKMPGGMTPEQMKQMAEEMKKGAARP